MSLQSSKMVAGFVLGIILLAASQYLSSSSPPRQEYWHYYVPTHNLIQKKDSTSFNLKHTAEGELFPLKLELHTQGDHKREYDVHEVLHEEIRHQLQQKKGDLKHVILKSQHPLDFHHKTEIRLLQGLTLSDPFVDFGLTFFKAVIPLARNLIIVGLVTGNLNLVMPLVILFQSATMLAFWTNEKHFLDGFYTDILNSKLDLINIFRVVISPSKDPNAIQILQKYNFTSNIFYNLSGELMFLMLFLIATIVIKVLNIVMKIERLRSINSKLRPSWNAVLFLLMPRLAVFSGFQLRFVKEGTGPEIINAIIAGVILIGLVVYFGFLVAQIRKINSRIEYIDESRMQIGMMDRISYKKDFQFDCLRYSMLHYCCMNYIRLLLYFIPIGASYDLHYVSYGGAIASQLIFVMINISCPGYQRNRDKVLYPFVDFIFIVFQLALIAVGLAESVKHSEVSIIAEKVYFAVLLSVFLLVLGSLLADLLIMIRTSCASQSDEDSDRMNVNILKKLNSEHIREQTNTNGNKENNSIATSSVDSEKDYDADDSSTIKNNKNLIKPRVKKVRKGKII